MRNAGDCDGDEGRIGTDPRIRDLVLGLTLRSLLGRLSVVEGFGFGGREDLEVW